MIKKCLTIPIEILDTLISVGEIGSPTVVQYLSNYIIAKVNF